MRNERDRPPRPDPTGADDPIVARPTRGGPGPGTDGPILAPTMTGLGVDPLHFAVIMCINLTIGLATPPMGLILFVASGISRLRVEVIALEMLPLLAVEILAIFVVTYFPVISMSLPYWLGFTRDAPGFFV